MLGIVGFGAAAEVVHAEQEATARHMAAMRDDLQDRLLCAFPQVMPELVALHAECCNSLVCLLLLLSMFQWDGCCLFVMDAIILSVQCSMYLPVVLGRSYILTCPFC